MNYRAVQRILRSIAIVLLAGCWRFAAAQKISMVDVGVVAPAQVISGETISAAMVANPRDFSSFAALQVIPAQIPGIPGVNSADLLKHYKVLAGGTNYLPADGPFSFKATDSVTLQITRSDLENAPVTTARLPLSFSHAPSPSSSDYGYSTPPVTQPGAVHLFHGPLSGDSTQTQLKVNGTEAKILAESPRELFCLVPPALQPGPVEWTLLDSGRRTRLKSWALALQMSADKLNVQRGESTAFHVYIKGVETIPKEAWFGSGDVPELIDAALMAKFLPGFQPPSPMQPGVLVLTLENLSTGTVAMSDGNKLALTFHYGDA
jgi:hypothetical protein